MVTFTDLPEKNTTVTKRPSNAGGFNINKQTDADQSKDDKTKN